MVLFVSFRSEVMRILFKLLFDFIQFGLICSESNFGISSRTVILLEKLKSFVSWLTSYMVFYKTKSELEVHVFVITLLELGMNAYR